MRYRDRYSFTCQDTSTRRQRSDLCSLRLVRQSVRLKYPTLITEIDEDINFLLMQYERHHVPTAHRLSVVV